MTVERPLHHKLDRSQIAFVVVVVAAYLVYFTSAEYRFDLTNTLLILVLGTFYLALGIAGERYAVEQNKPALLAGYFAVQLALGTFINFLGLALTWLVLLPMVGSAVYYASRRGAIFISALAWLGMAVPFTYYYGLSAFLSWAMPFLAAIVFVAVFTQTALSEQQARAALNRANQKLRESAAQAEELAIAQERNRLAREIHDGLGHYLTAVNIQIKAAQAMIDQDPALARNALTNAQQMTQDALADVRRSISSLRTDPATERPLSETITRLLTELRTADIQTHFTLTGAPRALPQPVEFTCYRAVQESLTNIRKHANARHVQVCLEYRPDAVRLTVEDDGVGAADTETGGYGLVGLRERVALHGGQLAIETGPGRGFRLQIEIPDGGAHGQGPHSHSAG
ncbi:MAG TPA: sensor histidine kinase [Anaerolineaceae bacterium]|nr:sensor histidine kinase [Anaerolineaceae bacterium]